MPFLTELCITFLEGFSANKKFLFGIQFHKVLRTDTQKMHIKCKQCHASQSPSLLSLQRVDIDHFVPKKNLEVPPPLHDYSVRLQEPFAGSKCAAIPGGESSPLKAGTVAPT